MSTFAVFGMTGAVALAEAKKTTSTKKPNPKPGSPPLELTEAEWLEKVQAKAEQIMAGVKVKQLSPAMDAPQYAYQFVELARKTGKCRDLRVRARCVMTDEKGEPIINPKTRAPKVAWIDYRPEMTVQVA